MRLRQGPISLTVVRDSTVEELDSVAGELDSMPAELDFAAAQLESTTAVLDLMAAQLDSSKGNFVCKVPSTFKRLSHKMELERIISLLDASCLLTEGIAERRIDSTQCMERDFSKKRHVVNQLL
ncbi:unnamed protein product [Urochloa humidicola]